MSWKRTRGMLCMPAVAVVLMLGVACGGGAVEPAAEEAPTEEAPAEMAAVLDGSTPINDLPNPYSSVDGWGKLPDGREWGSTAGVDIDPDGSLWAIDRCGGNSCAGSDVDPILKFDADGNVTASHRRRAVSLPTRAARGPRRQHLGDRWAGAPRR